MADIKPIQTNYNGYRFRSRLEARWAVFFDSMELKYEYELEGYQLPSGCRYLPDFYLPTMKVFVEVKPVEQIPFDAMSKMIEFATEGDHHLLLLIGTPGQEQAYLINRRSVPSMLDWKCGAEGGFSNFGSSNEEEVSLLLADLKENWRVGFGVTPFEVGWTLVYVQSTPIESFRINRAYLAAKGARFEFGESG